MEVYESSSNAGSVEGRCSVCGDPIPTARLKAIPTASECVTCKHSMGDEPLIKRYDEYFGSEAEDFVSTFYTRPNQYLQAAIDRVMSPGVSGYMHAGA